MARTTRIVLLIGAVLIVGVSLSACSSNPGGPAVTAKTAAAAEKPSATPTPVALDGEWKQTNSHSTTAWQTATITGTTIEVDWVSDSGATKSLYWAGSVVPPKPGAETFTWSSANDTSKTADALLASSDPTKTFTYDHGVISYSVSALGTTTTVKLAPEK